MKVTKWLPNFHFGWTFHILYSFKRSKTSAWSLWPSLIKTFFCLSCGLSFWKPLCPRPVCKEYLMCSDRFTMGESQRIPSTHNASCLLLNLVAICSGTCGHLMGVMRSNDSFGPNIVLSYIMTKEYGHFLQDQVHTCAGPITILYGVLFTSKQI